MRAIVAGDDLMVLERPAPSAVAAVERTIEACKSARQMVRQELTEAERSAEFKAMRVRDVAGAVVAAEALDDIVGDAERLRGELEAKLSVLSFIHAWVPRSHAAKVERALAATHAHGAHPAVARWQMALEELARDAAAELPK